MAEFANKRCPHCGKRPIDRRLVQCPDCRVPFEYESEPVPASSTTLTQAQTRALARQVLGSWKLWSGVLVTLVVLVSAAAWGMHMILERQAQGFLAELEQKSTNQFADAFEKLSLRTSRQISNQIASEFAQTRIRTAIEEVAAERSSGILSNAVWASLQSFREQLKLADAQLASATNEIATLSNNVKVAQEAAAQIAASVAAEPALLRLVDKTITRSTNNYVVTMFFKSSNGRVVGPVELVAGTYRQTAKILSFNAKNVDQPESNILGDSADAASLKFNASRTDAPVLLELVLSGPTIVKLVGEQLEEEQTIPVAIDRMQVPVGVR